jgi:hypothetical protein
VIPILPLAADSNGKDDLDDTVEQSNNEGDEGDGNVNDREVKIDLQKVEDSGAREENDAFPEFGT